MAVSVIVFVEDVARSLAFYADVVGAELDHFDEDGSYGELKSGIGFAAHGHVERHLDLSFHRNEPGGLPSGSSSSWRSMTSMRCSRRRSTLEPQRFWSLSRATSRGAARR